MSSITVAPDEVLPTDRRLSTTGRSARRVAISSAGTPIRKATATAMATLVGGASRRGSRATSSPLATTRVSGPWGETSTSAATFSAEQRTTRLPSAPARSASAARRGSSTFRTTARAWCRISALAAVMRSSLPMRSRCTGPMAVMALTSGGTSSHISAISPGP